MMEKAAAVAAAAANKKPGQSPGFLLKTNGAFYPYHFHLLS